jgi:hypothetical protein
MKPRLSKQLARLTDWIAAASDRRAAESQDTSEAHAERDHPMDDNAFLLETVWFDRVQEQKVIARFSSERNEAYREFISRCDDFEAKIEGAQNRLVHLSRS